MTDMWRFFLGENELIIMTPWFALVLADRAQDFLTNSLWTGYQLCLWPEPAAPVGCYQFRKIFERRWNVISRRSLA